MIMKCYCYFNRLTGQYEMPRALPYDKEFMVENVVSYIKLEKGKADNLLECDLYYFGTFDTKTGVYSSDKELLISLTKEAIYGATNEQSE